MLEQGFIHGIEYYGSFLGVKNDFTFNIAGVLLASIRAHKGGCFVSARDSRGLLQTVLIVLAVVGSFV